MLRGVDAQRPLPVFPVAPEDVPAAAVRAVRRTLLRRAGVVADEADDDDYEARVIVALVIAALAEEPGEAQPSASGEAGQ